MSNLGASSLLAARRKRRWLAAGGVVLAIVVIATLGSLPELLSERHDPPRRLFYLLFETPIIVGVLTLHDEWAVRRGGRARWSLFASLALAIALGLLAAAIGFGIAQSLNIELRTHEHNLITLPRALLFGAISGLLQGGAWTLGFLYPFAAEDARLRTLEAETHKLEAERLGLEAEKLRLEAEKLRAIAELASLRSQLEPHFLLNTLNAIAGLVTKRPKEARRLLACLGDLLRDSLRDPEEMQPLGEEITWLHRYAEILESRHSGALLFHWDIADDARAFLVPRLLLQPLVENAVNHGALRRAGGGEVTVRIHLEHEGDGHVVCEIEDNGPGMGDAEPRAGAFGVRSVRRRLALKYEGASLHFESSSRGTRSVVRFPRGMGRDQHEVAS